MKARTWFYGPSGFGSTRGNVDQAVTFDFDFVLRAAGLAAVDPDPPAELERTCTELVGGRVEPVECGRVAEGVCAYCGLGVCEKHNDPCYDRACRLHESCRADHFKETGHQLDSPTYSGRLIESLFEIVERVK